MFLAKPYYYIHYKSSSTTWPSSKSTLSNCLHVFPSPSPMPTRASLRRAVVTICHIAFIFILLYFSTHSISIVNILRQLGYGAGGFSYKSRWTLRELFPLHNFVGCKYCQIAKKVTYYKHDAVTSSENGSLGISVHLVQIIDMTQHCAAPPLSSSPRSQPPSSSYWCLVLARKSMVDVVLC